MMFELFMLVVGAAGGSWGTYKLTKKGVVR